MNDEGIKGNPSRFNSRFGSGEEITAKQLNDLAAGIQSAVPMPYLGDGPSVSFTPGGSLITPQSVVTESQPGVTLQQFQCSVSKEEIGHTGNFEYRLRIAKGYVEYFYSQADDNGLVDYDYLNTPYVAYIDAFNVTEVGCHVGDDPDSDYLSDGGYVKLDENKIYYVCLFMFGPDKFLATPDWFQSPQLMVVESGSSANNIRTTDSGGEIVRSLLVPYYQPVAFNADDVSSQGLYTIGYANSSSVNGGSGGQYDDDDFGAIVANTDSGENHAERAVVIALKQQDTWYGTKSSNIISISPGYCTMKWVLRARPGYDDNLEEDDFVIGWSNSSTLLDLLNSLDVSLDPDYLAGKFDNFDETGILDVIITDETYGYMVDGVAAVQDGGTNLLGHLQGGGTESTTIVTTDVSGIGYGGISVSTEVFSELSTTEIVGNISVENADLNTTWLYTEFGLNVASAEVYSSADSTANWDGDMSFNATSTFDYEKFYLSSADGDYLEPAQIFDKMVQASTGGYVGGIYISDIKQDIQINPYWTGGDTNTSPFYFTTWSGEPDEISTQVRNQDKSPDGHSYSVTNQTPEVVYAVPTSDATYDDLIGSLRTDMHPDGPNITAPMIGELAGGIKLGIANKLQIAVNSPIYGDETIGNWADDYTIDGDNYFARQFVVRRDIARIIWIEDPDTGEGFFKVEQRRIGQQTLPNKPSSYKIFIYYLDADQDPTADTWDLFDGWDNDEFKAKFPKDTIESMKDYLDTMDTSYTAVSQLEEGESWD